MPDQIVTRTIEDIFARAQSAEDDPFGWVPEVLLTYCDFETVKPFLKDGVTAEDWAGEMADPAKVREAAESYYEFALGKIADERGISAERSVIKLRAERSVIKLREYAWLMGRDDVVDAMDAAPYPMYGAPKVAVFGEAFGFIVGVCARCEMPVVGYGKAYCSDVCRLADKDHGPDAEPEIDGGDES
jgi:hypothetical protein